MKHNISDVLTSICWDITQFRLAVSNISAEFIVSIFRIIYNYSEVILK